MQLITLNDSGAIIIPQNIKEELGLDNKSQLSLEIKDGKLILIPLKNEPKLYYEGSVLVADTELLDDPNNIIESMRNERDNHLMSW